MLFLFFYEVDFAEIGRALTGANYIFILPAVVVLLMVMGLKAARWYFLLKPIRGISLTRIYPVEVIGHMANAILPLRLGELVRAYLLGEKEGISKISVLATVVTARALDGISLICFILVLSLFLPLAEWLRPIMYIAAAIFIFGIALLLALASSPRLTHRLATILLKLLPRRWRSRFHHWLELFFIGLAALKSPGMMTVAFLLSLLTWVAEGTMFYIIGLSFDLGQPFYVFLLAAAAANLALLIPSSPGGIGNFEYFCALSITFFGVAAAEARAYAIVLHVSMLIAIIIFGLLFMWMENLSIAQLAKSRVAPNHDETET